MNFKINVWLLLCFVILVCSCQEMEQNQTSNGLYQVEKMKELQNGDIIFHTSNSSQSKAIQLATHSKYSHMGILYEGKEQFWVYEAVQPVKMTPLQDWIGRGEKGCYVVKRLKDADKVLTVETLQEMRTVGERFMGKSYDLYFEWSDKRIYCSELVWKIYEEAVGIELGELAQLESFDLSSPLVRSKMQERYGNHIPSEEWVISPDAIFESPLLEVVMRK